MEMKPTVCVEGGFMCVCIWNDRIHCINYPVIVTTALNKYISHLRTYFSPSLWQPACGTAPCSTLSRPTRATLPTLRLELAITNRMQCQEREPDLKGAWPPPLRVWVIPETLCEKADHSAERPHETQITETSMPVAQALRLWRYYHHMSTLLHHVHIPDSQTHEK